MTKDCWGIFGGVEENWQSRGKTHRRSITHEEINLWTESWGGHSARISPNFPTGKGLKDLSFLKCLGQIGDNKPQSIPLYPIIILRAKLTYRDNKLACNYLVIHPPFGNKWYIYYIQHKSYIHIRKHRVITSRKMWKLIRNATLTLLCGHHSSLFCCMSI